MARSIKRSAGARWGLSLASVLVIGTLGAVAAFSLAAITTSSLHFSNRYASGQDAMYLAEAAITDVVDRLQTQNTYGTNGEVLTVKPDPNDATRFGQVSFVSGGTAPWSTNNLNGNANSGNNNTPVDSGTVLLIGIGHARGETRMVEEVVNLPSFPYAIASAGAFVCEGALDVEGATSMADFVAQQTSGQKGPQQGVSLGSNVSVTVTGPCTVTGNVTCPGGSSAISLPAGSTVGSVQASTVDLPDIHTADFDAGKFGATQIVPDTTLTPAPNSSLTGSNYYRPEGQPGTLGTLTVNGSLTLSNALLYVDGNLVVNGGLNGCGIVAVTGTTTVTGGVDVVSENNLIALVGDGDITLSGSLTGTVKPYFQGLVYTRGNFNAANITIAGEFILAPAEGTTLPADGSPLTSSGKMTLSDVSVVGINGLKFSAQPPPLPAPPLRLDYVAAPGNLITQSCSSRNFVVFVPQFNAKGQNLSLTQWINGGGASFPPLTPSQNWPGATGGTVCISEQQLCTEHSAAGATAQCQFLNMQPYYCKPSDSYIPGLATVQNSVVVGFRYTRLPCLNQTISTLGYTCALTKMNSDPMFAYGQTLLPGEAQNYVSTLQQTITTYNTQYQTSKPTLTAYQTNGPQLNLNTFFGNVTPIHVLSWKDLP